MAFHFSLQEVLEYRQRMEDERRREMEEARAQVEHVEDLLSQASERRGHYRDELSRISQAGKSFAHQQLYLDYLRGIDGLIEKTQDHLAKLRKELERRREYLAYAVRQREIMNELKKKEYAAYLQEERRAETKMYDAIALRNYWRDKQAKNSRLSRE